jgi:hypothetical protein
VSKGTIRNTSLAAALAAASFGVGMAQAAVTQVEGSAGGGLVPWALLHPQGPLASYTYVNVNDYSIQGFAVGGTIANRVELSFAHQMVNAPTVANALTGIGAWGTVDNRITQDVLGLKVKLLDMGKDDAVPQVAVGMQVKHANGKIVDILKNAGYIDGTSGTDWYVAATKFVTIGGKKVVLDGTLRATKANQMGVLGFGGGSLNGNNGYKWRPELSAGVFVADNVVFGGEYRAKPNNMRNDAMFGFKEEAAWDIFIAYFVNKNMAITAAYANLGQVGPAQAQVSTMAKKQDGLYLQLQANF